MNVHKNYGVFDPALSSVLLRGTFNDWNDQTPMDDSDNDGIYTLTYEGIESGIILYKFFYKNETAKMHGKKFQTEVRTLPLIQP